jgi:hypothetical protein
MRIDAYEFGRITIDHDVVIEAGRVRKRKKGPSSWCACSTSRRPQPRT